MATTSGKRVFQTSGTVISIPSVGAAHSFRVDFLFRDDALRYTATMDKPHGAFVSIPSNIIIDYTDRLGGQFRGRSISYEGYVGKGKFYVKLANGVVMKGDLEGDEESEQDDTKGVGEMEVIDFDIPDPELRRLG